MEQMVPTVWEEMSKENSQLALDIDMQTHKALCKVMQRKQSAEQEEARQAV